MTYSPPNGTLSNNPEHGLIWTTHCRKCGTEQRIRIGSVSLDQAREAVSILDRKIGECPLGFHVELGGWRLLWSLDLMLDAIAAEEHQLAAA